jgi:exodeoxyribonuclease VII small subunit
MSEAEVPGKAPRKRGGKAAAEAGREPAFEEALGRLEAIVARLEAGEMPLEDTVRLFEEGQGLVRACSGLLEKAEQRVKVLIEGTDQTRDLTPGTTSRGPADREGTNA